MIKLVIVDDHTLFREGLASIFQMEKDIDVVGLAGSVEEALFFVRKLKPDMVLMDFSLPDGTGVDATRLILKELPNCQIIFLTISERNEDLYAAIRSGAKGYLLKNMKPGDLVRSLRQVISGEAALSRKMVLSLIDQIADEERKLASGKLHPILKQLTIRELEVLEEIVKDSSNKEIASVLGISLYTVKNHISNIINKLGVTNRREAASLARKNKIGLTK